MTDEQLNALLRLKRFEQPPPGYFDRLLHDVHRRQREELLRRPLWRIAIERLQTAFSEHSMGPASYAGAMAAVVAAGIVTIGLMIPGDLELHSGSAPLAAVSAPVNREPLLSLQPSSNFRPVIDVQPVSQVVQPRRTAGSQPRYVIDARPATYEQPFQF